MAKRERKTRGEELVDQIANEENWARRAELVHEYRLQDEHIDKDIRKHEDDLAAYVRDLACEAIDISLWLSAHHHPLRMASHEDKITAYTALTANLCKIIEVSNGYDGPSGEDSPSATSSP